MWTAGIGVCVYFHVKPLVYYQGFRLLRGMRHEALLQGNCVSSVCYSIRSVVYSGGTLVDQRPCGGYSGVHIGGHTVVPVMNGHPRDQAKVSVHCRWPPIRGNITWKCVGRGIDNVAVQGRWPLTTGVA